MSDRDMRQREREGEQAEAKLEEGGWRGGSKQKEQAYGNNTHPIVSASRPNLNSEGIKHQLVFSP